MILYHGTRAHHAEVIARDGLVSSIGYARPQWFMLAEDFASASHHSQASGSYPVVVEFSIPVGPRNREWDGEPYLWPPREINWKGTPTRWWALRQPIPARFVRRVVRL